jgi:hypothetical protein
MRKIIFNIIIKIWQKNQQRGWDATLGWQFPRIIRRVNEG